MWGEGHGPVEKWVASPNTERFLTAALAIAAAALIASAATAEAASATAAGDIFDGVYAEYTDGAGLLDLVANWTLILPGLVIAHGLALLQFHAAAVLPAWLPGALAPLWSVVLAAVPVALFVAAAARLLLLVGLTEMTVNSEMPLVSTAAAWLTTMTALGLLRLLIVTSSADTETRPEVSAPGPGVVEVVGSDGDGDDATRFATVTATALITVTFMWAVRRIGNVAEYYAGAEDAAGASAVLGLVLLVVITGYLHAWAALGQLEIDWHTQRPAEVSD